MMKKGKSKLGVWLCSAVTVVLLLATALGLTACGDAKDLKIDVPARIEADLGTGTYVVPRYDVVNSKGLIMAGYNVRLKSATDPNGNAAEISRAASTIVTLTGAGEYTFVYTADNKNVPDATVIMDFADRTAPTIQLSSSRFPAFFIKGNTYAVPEYTLAGDYLASKCYTKVFYNSGAEGEEDAVVELNNGNFNVTHESGRYTVLIHVEDASGNFNDYRYVRNVYSPEHYEEDIVIYFNEPFAERQVAADGNYNGKYVSKADGGKAYGNELGSYKVEFTGAETSNNEAYFALNVPAITNVMDNKELEMYVFIDDEDCENSANKWVIGSKWWNDQQIEVGKWQRVTWSIDNWGNGTGANSGANTSQIISTNDISGTRIRLIPDAVYADKNTGTMPPPPHGTVYFSAMRLVPHEWANITTENGVSAPKRAYVGQTVKLNEPQAPAGETFDCFVINGKPISGNEFVVRESGDITIGAKFVTGELNKDNFTWGEASEGERVGSDSQTCKIGNSEYWALEYELYGMESGWKYTAAYVGGTHQLIGFEIGYNNDESTNKLSTYGGTWKTPNLISLTQAQTQKLRSATEENPAKVTYVRAADKILVLLNGEFVGVYSFASLEISGNDFGLGARGAGTIVNGTRKNIKYVVGETRVELAQQKLNLSVAVTAQGGAHADKSSYMIGDTVTLTHDAPTVEGKEFAYYTVNEQKISGNTFVATEKNYTVKAVYADICTLTLGDGVALADGTTGTAKVAQGAEVQFKFVGKSSSGKYFTGFAADETPVTGNTFTPNKAAHTITATVADRVDSGNVMLNDASKAATADGWISKTGYMPAKVEYVTDKKYEGADGAVPEDGVIKVTVNAGENAFALTEDLSALFTSDYKEIYFYAYSENRAAEIGGWWCRKATKVGEWVKITLTRADAPQNFAEKSVWTEGFTQFTYSFRGDTLKAGDVFYLTGVFGVPYNDVNVSVDNNANDYVSVAAPANGKTYKVNETVTLTHSGAPANKEFLRFTVSVNGGDYVNVSGSTYTIPETATSVTFGAEFADIATLTLEDGITVNGKSGTVTVAKGSVVTLAHGEASEQGKVFNGYKLNNSQTVYGNMFVASENTYAITADWVNASDIVWGEKNDSHDYKTVMSGSNETLQNYKYVGTAFGTSEYWAIKLDVKHTREWENLDFVVGEKVMLRIRYHQGGFFGIGLHVKPGGDDTYPQTYSEFYPAYANPAGETRNKLAAKFVAGTTVTCVRYGNKLSLYADNELFFTTEYAIDYTGNWFGVGYDTENPDNLTADNSLQVPNHKNVKFIMGQDKIDAYMESVKKLNAPEYDSLVKYAGGGTFEYTLPVATVTDMTGKTVNQNVTATATGINGAITVTDGKITLPEYNGTQNVTVTYSSADCINVSITVTFYNTSVAQINEIKNATAKDSSAIEYITSNIPEGLPDDISESGVLKVVAGSGDVGMTTNVNYNTISANYSEIYFYIYMESEADLNNIGCGAYWLNGEGTVVKNQWVKITFNSEMIAQLASGAANDLSKFTFRVNTQSWLQGTDVSGKTFYITSLYGVEK